MKKVNIEFKDTVVEVTIHNNREEHFVNIISIDIDMIREFYKNKEYKMCEHMCREITTHFSALYFLDCIASPVGIIEMGDIINE